MQYFQVGHEDQQCIQRIKILINRPFRNNIEINNVDMEKIYGLFVDHAPAYSDRLSFVNKHLLQNPEEVHHLVQCGLSETFDRFYTKESLLDDLKQVKSLFFESPGELRSIEQEKQLKFLKFLASVRVVAASWIVGVIMVTIINCIIHKQVLAY